MNKSIGQAAYEQWAKFINPPWANIAIEWDKLPESAKNGWEKIAEAAVNQQFRNRYQIIDIKSL